MLQRVKDELEKLTWHITPTDVVSKTDEVIKYWENEVNSIIHSEEKTFKSVVKKLERITGLGYNQIYMILFQSSVSIDPEVRKSSSEASQKISNFFIDLGYNQDLYLAICAVRDRNEELSEVDQKLLKEYLKDFERNGLHLSQDKQLELKELGKKISDIAIAFRQELNESNEKFVIEEEQLLGVPDNTKKNFTKNEDGTYSIGLSYPEFFAIMEFCEVPETRKFFSEQFSNIAVEQNSPRIEKLISLRHKKASILGFTNFAEYNLDIKLAKSPHRVFDFLNDLENKLKHAAKSILDELIILKKEYEPNGENRILSHDFSFYKRLYNEKHFDMDFTAIKKYFPLTHVLDGMFDFYQEMFGLSFSQINSVETWHEDVTIWDVKDRNSGEYLGRFYLDLHPRDGKYGHAAAFTLIKARQENSSIYFAPASAMVCNFNKPTVDEPSILSHNEVNTLFHEFGHIIHQIVTREGYFRYSGTSVKRDFVEAPSQMLENWTWEPEVVKRISKHIETGEPLGKDLLSKLKEAKDKFAPLDYLRQIFFAKFDLTAYSNESFDTQSNWQKMQAEISLIPAPDNSNRAASFGHMASGYQSSYYGYLWSEVYAMDLYSRFKNEGVTSQKVGHDYRKWILEPGGAIDEDVLVENYLGRKMNNKAFLESIGLK